MYIIYLCWLFSGKKEAPTFEDIINLIPEEKRVIVGIN
jgi:hypothetical protein